MKRWMPALALSVMLLISLIRLRLIGESILSLIGSVLLTVSHPSSPVLEWGPGIMEFRVAAAVWVCTAVFLVPVLRGRRRISLFSADTLARYRFPLRMMVVLAVVSLTCPLLTPVNPDLQGDLTHTRLLPPCSVGVLHVEDQPPAAQGTSWLEQLVSRADGYLIHRPMRLTTPEHTMALSSSAHTVLLLFGTDDTGRDVFSRVVYGTRVSFSIGLLAAIGALIIGVSVGIAAGLSGRLMDMVLMRLTDFMLAVPGMFLVIGLMAFLDESPVVIIVVLSITGWMHIARMVRSETRALRNKEFILAAQMLQIPRLKIVLRHFLPNLAPVLWTAFVLQFAAGVLGEATLGFLGFGIQPPTASWGNMLGEGTSYLGSAWWLSFFPGLILALVLIAIHSVSDTPWEVSPGPGRPLAVTGEHRPSG